jgi:hypothetical protein
MFSVTKDFMNKEAPPNYVAGLGRGLVIHGLSVTATTVSNVLFFIVQQALRHDLISVLLGKGLLTSGTFF